MQKYRNIKKTIDGIEFDSIKEASRYQQLKIMQSAKMISDLEMQPEFLLQESFKIGKETHRAIKYRADFKYITNKGVTVIEDVKGMKTEVYKIKKKLLLFKFPDIVFLEI